MTLKTRIERLEQSRPPAVDNAETIERQILQGVSDDELDALERGDPDALRRYADEFERRMNL